MRERKKWRKQKVIGIILTEYKNDVILRCCYCWNGRKKRQYTQCNHFSMDSSMSLIESTLNFWLLYSIGWIEKFKFDSEIILTTRVTK